MTNRATRNREQINGAAMARAQQKSRSKEQPKEEPKQQEIMARARSMSGAVNASHVVVATSSRKSNRSTAINQINRPARAEGAREEATKATPSPAPPFFTWSSDAFFSWQPSCSIDQLVVHRGGGWPSHAWASQPASQARKQGAEEPPASAFAAGFICIFIKRASR